ncbi:MAG: hypothetical protein KAR31_01395 [Candidatus Omnitrophica bacterium]|nr:hypothetical protein [Candidatus Omnitrophota bacterium]MCK5180388.1 hypothetical protein [Candidatus Omnitrophota bacterium]MCK5259541.1 hypothetical protein [Candidatus Omnitrophota bacterium]
MKRQAKSYSIVDHDLLHRGYLGCLTHQALALYLFLVVVGDWEGKSFYSASSIGKILRMDFFEICKAKEELCTTRLIDYKKPYWWVMTLTSGKRSICPDAMNPLIKQVLEKMETTKND